MNDDRRKLVDDALGLRRTIDDALLVRRTYVRRLRELIESERTPPLRIDPTPAPSTDGHDF